MSQTTTLEAFRAETRAWLEANCPPEMREPMRGEQDYCWGGRNARFQSDAQQAWLERMAERGWTVPTWPQGLRRRRPVAGRGHGAAAGDGAARAAGRR